MTEDPKWRIPSAASTTLHDDGAADVWAYDAGHGCVVRPQTAPPRMMPEVNLDEAVGKIDEVDKRMLVANGIYTVLSSDTAMSEERPGGHEVIIPSMEEVLAEEREAEEAEKEWNEIRTRHGYPFVVEGEQSENVRRRRRSQQ